MKKLRILVVEDDADNIKAAKAMLEEEGHEVVVVSGYNQAVKIIHRAHYYWYLKEKSERKEDWEKICKEGKEALLPLPFDILLTDVKIPKYGYETMSEEGEKIVDKQGVMPYGAYIVLFAIEKNIKRIGMITSGDHHADPFVAALDILTGFSAGELKVVITNKEDIVVMTEDYKTPAPNDYSKREGLERNGKAKRVKNWLKLLTNVVS